MRRIKITSDIDKKAIRYSRQLTIVGIRKDALIKLQELVIFFADTTRTFEIGYGRGKKTVWHPLNTISYQRYILHLIKRYDALRAIHPRKFIREWMIFEKIVPKRDVVCKLKINGVIGDSLSDRIVQCMAYNKVREKVFPQFVRELGICTCIYCNETYTVTDINGNAFYDLDHWKPKSYYPFLCTSFYNLQPSCPPCNRRKSNQDNRLFFNLWDDVGSKNLDVLRFQLDHQSLITYLSSFNKENLKINFSCYNIRYKKMEEDMDECLHISTKYAEHKDIVEEIVWKHQTYNRSYLDSLRKSLGTIVPSDAEINRFILGTYSDPDSIFKRPLTRMIQNIAHDIGLL